MRLEPGPARKVKVVNLGLEPEEGIEMGLEPEKVVRKNENRRPVADYVPSECAELVSELAHRA